MNKTSIQALVSSIIMVIALIALPTRASAKEQAEEDKRYTLIKNVNVFDGKSSQLHKAMSVLIKKNIIVSFKAEVKIPESATVIDGGDRTLMPGLIDTHVHLMIDLPPDAILRSMDLVYMSIRGSVAARKTLMRGFTSVRDMSGPTFGLKRAIDEELIIGPRIYPSGAALSQTSGHGDFRRRADAHRRFGGSSANFERWGYAIVADGRAEVLAGVREQLRLGASQIKLMAGGGVVSDYDPLDVRQYTDDELRAAVQAAEDWDTYVAVHIYNAEGIRRAISAGVKSIEHGNLIEEDTMILMSKKGAFLSPQSLLYQLALPGFDAAHIDKLQKAARGLDLMMRLAKKHRVKVTFSTDLIGSSQLQNMQAKEFSIRTKWFTPIEILRQATSVGAELLALSGPRNPYPGRLGVIESGALADLLVVDGNPLEDITVLEKQNNLRLIVKDGKVFKNTLP